MIHSLADNKDFFAANLNAQTEKTTLLFQEARDQFTVEQAKTRDLIKKAIREHARAEDPDKETRLGRVISSTWEYQSPNNDLDNDDCDMTEGDYLNRARIETEAAVKYAILRSLDFPSMQSRQLGIPEAHSKTFEWIYSEPMLEGSPWSNFSKWLRKGHGIYWVNGKAGSGKSTLMRFIFEDQRTSDFLRRWSGSAENITIAGFFFWNSGTPEESSQHGLLRSLLHKILSLKPQYMPTAFPERWHAFEKLSTLDHQSPRFRNFISAEKKCRMTLPQLMQAFQRLLKQDLGNVCLFIDGLDEYNGDPMDTIRLFKLLISPRLKICLSSRPWLAFEDAFRSCPQLKLQDLTRHDIQIYVNDKLLDDERMQKMCDLEPLEAPKLVQEIVDKASGVFLWIKLVVASLLRGLTNRDQILDLQKRLRILPSELESLFTYMIRQIEPVYQEEGLKIFQIILRSQEVTAMLDEEEDYTQVESLCAIDLSFAFEPPSVAIKHPIKLLDDEEAFRRVDEIEHRLKVRCAGLLEIPTSHVDDALRWRKTAKNAGNTKIHWLHRTVKDFMQVADNQALLKSSELSEWSPSLCLLCSSVMRLKTWFLNTPATNSINPLPGLAARAMIFAHQTEREFAYTEVELLEELDTTIFHLRGPAAGHWACEMYKTNVRETAERGDNFLSLAVKYDLPLYLSQKLRTADRDMRNKLGRPYLDYIVWPEPSPSGRSKTILATDLTMKRDVLKLLLKHGCCPNQVFDGITPWQIFQIKADDHFAELGLIWIEIIDLFLRSGADPTPFKCDGRGYDIQQTVELAFQHDFPVETQRLLELLTPTIQTGLHHRRSSARAMSWLKKRLSHNKASG
jgi:hypothetical protein